MATARGAFDVEIPIENPGRRQSQIVVPTGRTRRDRYRDPRRDGNVFGLADASLRLRPGLGLRAAARKKAAPILRFGFEEGAGVATTGSSFHWIDANHPVQRASSFQPGAEVQSSVSTRGRSPVERLACDERRTDGRRAPRRQCNGRGGAPYIVVERRPRDRGRRGPGVSVSEGAAGSAVEGVEGNERSSRSSLSSEGSCATQGLGASAALLNYTCSSISQSHACALDRDQTVEEIVSVDRSLGVCISESGGGRRSGWRTDERLTVAALTGFWQRLLLRSNRGFSMRSPRPRNIGGGR